MKIARRRLITAAAAGGGALIASQVSSAQTARSDGPLTVAEQRELLKEVRYLRDRQEILDCVNRYARGLDRLDAEAVASAYHADGIDHHGPFVGRRDELVKWVIPLEARLQATSHCISNHLCEITGDTAHAESYVTFFMRSPDGKRINCGGGRYIDRLERRDGIWRIALREATVEWTFGVDAPASQTMGYPPGSRDKNDPSYQRPLRLAPDVQEKLDKGAAG